MALDTEYHLFTLGNGLRCVFRRSQDVGYCGIVVNAGSRDDGSNFGLAHFVEHTIFKGTNRRRSHHISSRMETIGGELNAYTTKDETVVYTTYPAGHSSRAMELLVDLASDSTFPACELDKEREVVVDEINSYLDTPSESVFDEFEDRLFAGSTPGHNILGTPQSVNKLDTNCCLAFREKYYCASNMTLYCTDDCTPQQAHKAMERYFGCLISGKYNNVRGYVRDIKPFDESLQRDGHQAHTVLGTRIGNRNDEDRYALFLLNNHFGGMAMNSLLNRELREKRGYVYTADSSVNLMEDCGIFQIYFGCDVEHVDPCTNIARRLLSQLAESAMKPNLFEKIRRQYLGQLIVGNDNRESQAISMGRSLMYYNEIHDIEYATHRIQAVTPERVRCMAERILTSQLSRLTIC